MTGREINYKELLRNVEEMIELLEFDSMRSAGKCKLNATTISDLYDLKDRYVKVLAADKKSAPKKAATEAAE